jgi:peptide/nickel transport system permease protein
VSQAATAAVIDVALDVASGLVALVGAGTLAVFRPSVRSWWRDALVRGLDVVFTIAAAVVVVGMVAAIVPGDPIARALGEDAPEEARAALADRLGIVPGDHPCPRALRPLAAGGHLVTALSRGSLTSLRGEPVSALVRPRLAASLRLGGTALIGGLIVGVILGVLAGRSIVVASASTTMTSSSSSGSKSAGLRRWGSFVAACVAIAMAAVPRVVLGPALLVVVAVWARLLPAGGDDEDGAIVLPALTLALPFAGVVARHVRVAVDDAVETPFVRAALARGASAWRVTLLHVIPHALMPVVSLTGLQAGAIVSGAVLVERVFSWPGIGTLLLERMKRGDLPVVVAIVALAVIAVVLSNALARAALASIDPRLRRPP